MITWKEIEDELAGDLGYRQAFVKIFRKYEGQKTDELTAQNHPVKVTATSFAKHFGIAVQTFADWIKPPTKPEITNTVISEAEANAKAAMDAQIDQAKAEAEAEAKAAKDAAKDLIEEVRAANAAKARAAAEAAAKAKPPKTEAEKKAREAEKSAFVDGLTKPINDVVAALGFPCAVGSLGEAYDQLQEAFDRGDPLSADTLKDAYEVVGQITELLMKLELLVSK